MLSPSSSVRFVGQRLSHGQLRWEFVAAVRAAVRVLEPLLDALVAENMFTFGKTNGILSYTLWITEAEFVVADDAGWEMSEKHARQNHAELTSTVLL